MDKLWINRATALFSACRDPIPHEINQLDWKAALSANKERLTDKSSLDIFWLKDDSLDNLDDLPPPDVLQQEIIEHLEAALASFRDVAVGLRGR